MSIEGNGEEKKAENGEQTDAYRARLAEWELTFNAIVDPVYILNTSGEILRANRAAEDMFGMEQGAAIGLHCYNVVHRAKTFIKGCPFEKMKASLRRESYVVMIQDRWFIATVDPVLDRKSVV